MVYDKILSPSVVNFAVTRECNLRCKHCYTDSTDSPHPNELTTTEAKQAVKEIAEAGTRLLTFDGGEPLMRDDIYELVSYATENDLTSTLTTNATLLSTEAVEWLKKAGIGLLAISLHGADAKSHDDFCGIEGSWERAMAGIHNATKAQLPFQINTSIHHYNFDQFDDIVNLASDLGAIAIEPFSFVPVGRGKEYPDFTLNPEERKHVVTQIIQHQLNDKNMGYCCYGIPQLWVELKKKVQKKEEQNRFVRACCGAAMRYAFIFYEGTVYPCWVLHKGAGNIRNEGFQKIWQESEVFKILRNRAKLEGKCSRCGYKLFCGGPRCIVFERTGSLTKAEDACWFPDKELQKPIVIQETGCEVSCLS
jgi:radical SAM protein with 4Fe4S-binding SPASM domain